MPNIKNLLEGRFARVGYSLVEGAVVTILSEGKIEESSFEGRNGDDDDERLTLKVEINGEKKLLTPNMTSMREIAKAWGHETKGWVGKQLKVTLEKKRVFGEVKNVAYYHPIVKPSAEAVGQHEVIEGDKASPDVEEMIFELEMCANYQEFQAAMKSFVPRINKLEGKNKEAFVREKQSIEARFAEAK